MAHDPLSRLYLELAASDGLTVQDLSIKLGVSVRSIHRYLGELQEGFSALIVKEPGPGRMARYRIDSPNSRKDSHLRSNLVLHGLTDTEVMLLSMGLSHLAMPETTNMAQELQGLATKLELLRSPMKRDAAMRPPETWILSASSLAKTIPIGKAILANLLTALSRGLACSVEYRSVGSHGPKAYVIDPVSVFDYDGGLYVFARKRDGEHMIPFALERFSYVEPLRESARIPEGFDPQAYLRKAFNLVVNDPIDRVHLWIGPRQAPYIQERVWGDRQEIRTNADGSLELTFDTLGGSEVVRWILSQGSQARVMGPPELAGRVRTELERALDLYRA